MGNSNRIAEETALKNVMGDFIGSYAERDKNVDFSNWLAERLQSEMPSMPEDASRRLSGEIIEAVAEYDRTLSDLDEAVDSGRSKEEWLAERMLEAGTGMPLSEAGGVLRQINNDLNASNTLLMQEIGDASEGGAIVVDAELVEWNEYSVKSKALEIGRQALMSGLGAAAMTVKANMESGDISDISGTVGRALRDGVEAASGEVKAVVAGAIKTAAEKGLTDMLPADTPVETICDMAGAAVESASALFDAATGKSTMTEALDKAGRASIAAVCRFGAETLKGSLAAIPVVGPLVVRFAGGLLDHMESPKFSENVYTVVREAAVATWEGIKQTGRSIWNELKNSVKQSLYN
jgi:hypothetical protein